MARNSLQEGAQPIDQIQPEALGNLKSRKVLKQVMPDGSTKDISLESIASRLDEDGCFEDIEERAVIYDQSGAPHPAEHLGNARISHQGHQIMDETRLGECQSWFHRSPNRNVYLGVDGRLSLTGKCICNKCWPWHVASLLGGATLIGCLLWALRAALVAGL